MERLTNFRGKGLEERGIKRGQKGEGEASIGRRSLIGEGRDLSRRERESGVGKERERWRAEIRKKKDLR